MIIPGIIASQSSGGVVPPVGAWTPAAFPSLTGWWAIDDLSAVADGANVTSWAPRNGTAGAWDQRASGATPDKLVAAGEHQVDFSAAQSESLDSATTLASAIGATGLCALVFELTGTPSSTAGNWYDNNGLIGDSGGYWGISAVNLSGTTPSIRSGVWDGSPKQVIHPMLAGPRHIVMMWRTPGGVLTSVLDDGAEQTVAAGAPLVMTGTMQLGCNYNATAFANVRLVALVTATANGTTTDRTQLKEYLRATYIARTLSPPAGYALVFSDEFGYSGAPDPTKWVVEAGSNPAYATVGGGKLTLRCSGTSEAARVRGSIRTSDSAYMTWWGRGDFDFDHMWAAPGWLEISMKPAEVAGVMSNMVLWTDFVENPPASGLWELGEIDVVEARGFQPGIMDVATHAWSETVPGGAEPSHPDEDWVNRAQGGVSHVGSNRYHQFVCQWDASYVRTYIDGRLYHQRNLTSDPYPIYGRPSLLILEAMIATAGTFGANFGPVTYPIDTTMEVEHVRFYRPLPLPVFVYYPYYNQSRMPAGQYFDWSAVTHIVHYNVEPNANASLRSGMVQSDRDELIPVAHDHGVKVLLNIGGSGSQSADFPAATATSGLRATLISNLLALVSTNGYDGIDLNWEPMTDNTSTTLKNQYIALASELRAAMAPSLLLTCSSFSAFAPLLAASMEPSIDYFLLQGYGMWAPYDAGETESWHHTALFNGGVPQASDGRALHSLEFMLGKYAALPQSKIAIGMGMFGIIWTGGTGMPQGGVTGPRQAWTTMPTYDQDPYYLLVQRSDFGTTQQFDATARVPYLSRNTGSDATDQFVSYDNATSLAEKVAWIASQGVGGLMLWEAGEDFIPASSGADAKHPLLTAIRDEYESQYGQRPTIITPASPTYSPNGVVFNGATYANKTTAYTGATDGKLWTGALALKLLQRGAVQRILRGNANNYAVSVLDTWHFQLMGRTAAFVDCLVIQSSIQLDLYVWYTIYWSIDLADTAKRHIFINGVDRTGIVTTYDTAANINFNVGSNAVGAVHTGTQPLFGELADVWMEFGRYAAPTETNLRKFFDAHNRVVDKGSAGATPFGAAPHVFFSGATASWLTNKGSGGNPVLVAGALSTSAEPPAGADAAAPPPAPFAKDGAPQFSLAADSTSTTHNHSHTFGADANALTVIVGVETTDVISSIVIDPAGANIALAALTSAANGVTKIFAYKAHGLSGLVGAKTVRITWSGTNSKDFRVQSQSYNGAANVAPTPTDSDAAATGTSIALSLTAPDPDGILQVGAFINGGSSGVFTATGYTETDDTFTGGGGGTFHTGEKIGSLASPTNVSASWSASDRNTAIAFVVNPA